MKHENPAIHAAICLLLSSTVRAPADQQMIHHPSIRLAAVAMATGVALASACSTTASAAPPLVIAQSDLAIGGDPGPFHAAWAVQRPEANN